MDQRALTRTIRAVLITAFLVLVCTQMRAQVTYDPMVSARALVSQGKLAEAQQALAQFVTTNPGNAEAHFLLGYILFRLDKPKESLAEFTAGAAVRRPDASDLKVVASDYVLLKDYADADKWFSAVVTESPADADGWYLLGRTKFNEEDFAGAIQCFRQALALQPRLIEAENNLGLALQQSKQKAEAETAFQTAIEWQGDAPHDAQPFLNLGILLTEQGEAAKALPHLKKAVELSPGNPKAHEELAKAYSSLQQLEPAQGELEAAVKLAPESSSLHYKLGQMYRKRGLGDLAQQQFDICEKLNSTHSSTATPNPPR